MGVGGNLMENREINTILEQHRIWLATKGKKGEKANFKGAALTGANFRGVTLIGANFQGADLERTDFEEADIRKAFFQEANFKYANLRGADLRGADLQAVDLQGVDLLRTNLVSAKIRYTNLKHIKIDKNSIIQIPAETRRKFESTWFIMDFECFISRSVNLRPEYLQSAAALLGYFGTVLRAKLPNINAKVRVEQYETRVTITIDPLRSDRIIIEKTLDDYGMVVSGKLSPREFTDDPVLTGGLMREIQFASDRIHSYKKLAKNEDVDAKEFLSAFNVAFKGRGTC